MAANLSDTAQVTLAPSLIGALPVNPVLAAERDLQIRLRLSASDTCG